MCARSTDKRDGFGRRLLRYCGAGIVTTIVYFAVGALLFKGLGLEVSLSTTVAFAAAVAASYLMHYYFTFRSDEAHMPVMSRYLTMITGGMAINWLATHYLFALLGSLLAVQVIATVLLQGWNFLLNFLWVFRKP